MANYEVKDINGDPFASTAAFQTMLDDLQDDTDANTAIGMIITDATTARTFALTDAGKHINCTSASAVTITLPQNSDVAIPIGSEIVVTQYGAGTVSFAAGTGATVYSISNYLDLSARYAGATCKKMASDDWLIIGSLA